MDEQDSPGPMDSMNLTPVVIHKDEIIHLLQSGIEEHPVGFFGRLYDRVETKRTNRVP